MTTATATVSVISTPRICSRTGRATARSPAEPSRPSLKTSSSTFRWVECGPSPRWPRSLSAWQCPSSTASPPANGWSTARAPSPTTKSEILAVWDQADKGTRREIPHHSAAPFRRSRYGLRPVDDAGNRHDSIRHRQRDPSSRPGLRLPARPGHRAAALLGAVAGTHHPARERVAPAS